MTLPLYTVAEIAAVLGLDRKTVREHLEGIEALGIKSVNGQEASAWSISQLPPGLIGRLQAAATQWHCRTVEALLDNPKRRWQPPVPLDQIHPENIQAGIKLREALSRSLHHQHDTRTTAAEKNSDGVADYARVFGHSIQARQWYNLFARTIKRDNGFEEWNRLEIYLDERPKLKAAPADEVSQALNAVAGEFAELADYIGSCSNPNEPTEIECRGIWTLAFDAFTAMVRAGRPKKAAARRVRDFLSKHAAFLAPSRNALRMAFDRRLERVLAAAGDVKALRDGRENNRPSFQLPENDRDMLVHSAVFYYRGDIAPAWRQLLRGGKFSPEVLQRYKADPAKKSYVPASVMDTVGAEVEILTTMYQGPRAYDAIKGYVTRSYDGIYSMQCVSGDDFTLNTYFYVPDGNGWFELTRGQVILFIDFRTLRILGWALEPHKSYSSLTIRTLCTHVFGEFGVPKVLYFERGIWKTATLLQGKKNPFTFVEISQGLREFGVTFKHAIRPRTKVVERIGGIFQDIAEAEPGYCGRDERRDAPESLRKQMAEVEARKVHPSKYFYSLDQWNQRIGQLVEQYNTEPQQGHILAGLSPEEGFEAHLNINDPPLQFSASMRYLLAHDKRLLPVTLNGVTIQIGKQKFNYKGPEIAHLVNRQVLAWFDPESPETIVVTNPDRTNPICVGRSENPNALESLVAPESGALAREMNRIGGQASHMKTRYNVVKAKFPLPQRQMLAAAQAVDLGEQIAAQKTQVAETQTRQRRQRSHAARITRETGIAISERQQSNVSAEDMSALKDLIE